MKFLTDLVRKHGAEAKVDEDVFQHESGVGIVVTEAQIQEIVNARFSEVEVEIKELGHSFDFPKIIYKVRE